MNSLRTNAFRFLCLFESQEFYDDYERVREQVVEEWYRGQQHQSWTLIPKAKLIRMYQEYGKYGRINENALLDALAIVRDCAIKIIINSETKDNDDWPYGDEPDLYLPPKDKTIPGQGEFGLDDPRDNSGRPMPTSQVDRLRDRAWTRWFLFVSDLSNNPWIRNTGEVKGNARYSDGSRSLVRFLEATYTASTPEAQMMALDRMLNFVHGLGNMAKWFVEGGVATLNQIADFAPQGATLSGFRA
jgi:hypothetical protein